MSGTPQRWSVSSHGREHVLEIVEAGLGRRLTWTVDGEEVASRKTSDERVVLGGDDAGALGVRLPTFAGPARRVTLYDDEVLAHAGVGGLDLDPEPGSRAAEREAWIRAHPHLHTARRTAVAAAGVLVPLLVLWLLSRVVLQAVPWPDVDLPSIPWPDVPWPPIDLPAIPWPSIPWPDVDLPSIPWPDLPDLPPWVRDAAKLVGPVLLAFVLARGEVRRRRQQDERKAVPASGRERAEGGSGDQGSTD